MGTYPEGIDHFDQTNTAITTYKQDVADPQSLSLMVTSAISEDDAGNLWMGTDGGGLNYFDRDTGKFSHLHHGSNDPNTISNDAVLTTHIDKQGMTEQKARNYRQSMFVFEFVALNLRDSVKSQYAY